MATWEDVRRLALGLPETTEDLSHGNLFWRVRDKGFVWERPLRAADLRPSATPRQADRSSARASSTSSPRRHFWPTTPKSSSPRHTSTASLRCWCDWMRSSTPSSRRSSSRPGWRGRRRVWRRTTWRPIHRPPSVQGKAAGASRPPPAGQLASTTGFESTPIRSTSTSTWSPGRSEIFGSRNTPTPSGVPVRIRSPGSSVNTAVA